MRHPSDYPNQEPRTTLGDHDNPPITASVPLPRFSAEFFEKDPHLGLPEWARNMQLYGGLVGETADGPKTERLQAAVAELLQAQSSALSFTYLALTKLAPLDVAETGLRAVHSGATLLITELERLLKHGN